VKATKRAVKMATRVAGKDEDNGEGGKSKGNGAKRAIARRRVMVSNKDNKMMATETMTHHCCRCHCCPCLSCCSSSLCFGVLVAAGKGWWQRMRTMVGAEGGEGRELCVEF
jgi:hypothetical protein